jgi:hypothetical protein
VQDGVGMAFEVSPQALDNALPAETATIPDLNYQQVLDLMVRAFKRDYLADVKANMIGFDPKAYYGITEEIAA